MDKKGKFNALSFIMGVGIFSILITIGFIGINDTIEGYSITEPEQTTTLSKIKEVSELTDEMSITAQSGNVEETDLTTKIFKELIVAVKYIFGIPAIFIDILEELSNDLGLPSWFFPIALLGLVIAIVGALIYVIMGRGIKTE